MPAPYGSQKRVSSRIYARLRPSAAMSQRIPQIANRHRQRVRLPASAAVAASTFALGMTFVLPTIVAAHAPNRPDRTGHGTALHAAGSSSHDHHTSLSDSADLIASAAGTKRSFETVSAAPAGHPHTRVTPTASARGPPGPGENP
jgi:hypothetical protein